MGKKKAREIEPSYDESKLRSLKKEVSGTSARLEDVVDELVQKYSNDLDDFIEWTRECIETRDQVTDVDLEKMAIRIPVYMYFTASGLERLGIEYDSAKATKLETFNRWFEDIDGTIQDKKAGAELETLTEQFLEIAFQRAYKQLKAKLEVCDNLCLSIRKIIGKRTQDISIHRYDRDIERNDHSD